MRITKGKRLVKSGEDCADCLCRVCARNRDNDSINRELKNGEANCSCNCKPGDELIETEEDCPRFLPDEEDKDVMSTIRNQLVIVHDCRYEEIKRVREDAIAAFTAFVEEHFADLEPYEEGYDVAKHMVSPIMKSPVAIQEYTFFIMGDCSKEGSDLSQEAETFRNEWMRKTKLTSDVQNIVLVDLGEGDALAFCKEIE